MTNNTINSIQKLNFDLEAKQNGVQIIDYDLYYLSQEQNSTNRSLGMIALIAFFMFVTWGFIVTQYTLTKIPVN